MASAHPGPGREGLEDGARQPSPSLTPFRDNENFIEYRQVVDPKTTYKIGFHNSAPLNVFAMFQRSCKAHPEREAMVWLDDRGEVQEEWTYGEFFERSVSLFRPSPTPPSNVPIKASLLLSSHLALSSVSILLLPPISPRPVSPPESDDSRITSINTTESRRTTA